MSFDFVTLNAVGYLTYTISLSMLYFSVVVRNEYAQRHKLSRNGELTYPLVRLNDVAYAYHGLVLVLYTAYQVFSPVYKRGKNQRVSELTKTALAFGVAAALGLIIYTLEIQSRDSPKALQMVDVANILGNVKVVMSFSKYIPQILWNHRRKSTRGFSIDGIRINIVGSLLSLGQLFLDGYIRNDLKGVWNNSVKLALAAVTLLFDGILVLQSMVYGSSDQTSMYKD